MPSACTKPNKMSSVEVPNSIKSAMAILEKKVRNLEKRKGKLEVYQEKLNEGEDLNEDQRSAAAKYGGVVHTLEFARELQDQFATMSLEAEKLLKRQQKSERTERHIQEMKRVQELLRLQGTLDSMGSDEVRADFLSGSKGALTLTEANLDHLDELYKLISPTRDSETCYEQELKKSVAHITAFLENKDKEVASMGTTYKQIHELVNQINKCGYFDRKDSQGNDEQEADSADKNEDEPEKASEADDDVEEEEEEHIQFEQELSEEMKLSLAAGQVPIMPESLPASQTMSSTQSAPSHHEPAPVPVGMLDPAVVSATHQVPPANQGYNEDSYYSGAAMQVQAAQRPFQDIVSAVQGQFDFLQESHIQIDSPHRDPAVVAAHPMPTRPQDGSMSGSYQTSGLLEEQSYLGQSTQKDSQDMSASMGSHSDSSAAQLSSQYSEQSIGQSDPVSSGTYASQGTAQSYGGQDQTYSQNMMSQSLPDGSQQSYADQISQSHSAMDSSLGLSGAAPATGEGPQPIPMPGQSYNNNGEEGQSASSQSTADNREGKRPFAMNPNAVVFRSAYNNQSNSMAGDLQFGDDESMGGASGQESKSFSQAASDDYNYNNYNNQQYNSGFGGYNSRGQRGGNRGNRGNRGSGYSNNGGYNRGRGGNNYMNGGGNRNNYGNGNRGNRSGGSTSQGYPPRVDYRSEGSGYQKRNVNDGYQQGAGRSAVRGGAGGAPRGSGPRGNGNTSGGNRGFGRPSSGGMQQPQGV